jgi:TonB family protein
MAFRPYNAGVMKSLPTRCYCLLLFYFAFGAVRSDCQTTDLQRHLRDQYENKIFILRGFFSGDRLLFDPTGAPIAQTTSGDWTTDGFVLVTDIQVSEHQLSISASRLIVISWHGEFRFWARTQKQRTKKAPLLGIDVLLNSPQQEESALSTIFLTSHDNLADLVPGFWRPCLTGASGHFSSEMKIVPGVPSPVNGAEASSPQQAQSGTVFRVGSGVTPPRVILQREPVFDEDARKAGYGGTVTLMLVVSQKGVPTDIRVAEPLGHGLDAKAVEAVQSWRFAPSKKDGEPVAVEIAVEIQF